MLKSCKFPFQILRLQFDQKTIQSIWLGKEPRGLLKPYNFEMNLLEITQTFPTIKHIGLYLYCDRMLVTERYFLIN